MATGLFNRSPSANAALATFAALFAALVWSGCLSAPKSTTPLNTGHASDPDADDIREAVFRYQFEHNASGQQQSAKVYFLALNDGGGGEKDPADAFMARFADNRPPVRKISRATASAATGVNDKVTNERGLIFRVGEITMEGPDKASASGGYYEAGRSASGNMYTVEKKNGKWTVTKNEMHWISQIPFSADRRTIAEATLGVPEDLEKAKTENHGLGLFVRSLIGLNRNAAKNALSAFTQNPTLRANQLQSLDTTIREVNNTFGRLTRGGVGNATVNHLTEHGANGPLPQKTVGSAQKTVGSVT